ncbi:putative transmembrane protein 244 [Meriones unguiculatus]|uniref:putative transmembrane protein 244 n=1 Tax=Meriones unguiculatus TaxID=10047 RepID=UPI00293E543F|nr:putative transmembrane protein 244 [Meriones unguiculatus]
MFNITSHQGNADQNYVQLHATEIRLAITNRKENTVNSDLWFSLPGSPQVALQSLLVCVILFYTVYYLSLSTCCLALRACELDILAPFDFKTRPSWLNTNYKVLLVSTEVTYFVCGLLFALIVEEWVWDYAISVTILHVIITSAVMSEFPLTSHWWAALGT